MKKRNDGVPQRPKKVIAVSLAATIADQLREIAPQIDLVAGDASGRPADLLREVTDADAFLGNITPELLRAARKLTWVHSYSAGEKCLFPEMVASDVVLTTTRVIQGPQVADHALALLLALTRDLKRVIAGQARGDLETQEYKAIELEGKTAVIIGVGGIGLQIARRVRAFGMTVLGVDPQGLPRSSSISRLYKPAQLDDALRDADVAIASVPLTAQTEGMIGAKQFRLMKPSGYFIGISRGKVYQTGALVEALAENRLAGAGLDVTDPEPLPPDHPLWKLDNVIITPHVASRSDHLYDRQYQLIKENLALWIKGKRLRNVVDKRRGY